MAAGKVDELKGRAKEAAGVLTNDKKLKQDGRADQVAGKVKQAAEKTVDAVRRAVK